MCDEVIISSSIDITNEKLIDICKMRPVDVEALITVLNDSDINIDYVDVCNH
jgi:hypothetical protein